MIVTGLGDILGYGIFIGLLLIFSFILMLISRGAGTTSLISVFFLSIYLFATEKIGQGYLISTEWFLTVVLLIGLFIGFMIYVIFLRE